MAQVARVSKMVPSHYGPAKKNKKSKSPHDKVLEHVWKELAEKQLQVKKWATKKRVATILHKYGMPYLEQLIATSEKIWSIASKLGLKKKELFKIVEFIETDLPRKVKKGDYYLCKEETKLARTIEVDPDTKRIFIHLKKHNVSQLGKGWHKRVTRSIMYHAQSPEIVANCVGDRTVFHEGKILKKLKNSEGIAETYAIGSHVKEKSGKKVYSLIMKLYNAHSLRSYQFKMENMSRSEQLVVAKNLCAGLEHMHQMRLAHLDLHSGNFLVDRHEDPLTGVKTVSAALIDFGQVQTFDVAKKRVPRVEIPRRFVTPESLLKLKHRVDVRKIEVFALGWNLYHLYFGELPEWAHSNKFYKLKTMGSADKKAFSKDLQHDISKHINRRKKELTHHDKTWNEFGKLILQMCDPDPEKRPSAHTCCKTLESLITN